MVDEHLAVAKSTGDNIYLDLDGILFLGIHFWSFDCIENLLGNYTYYNLYF